MEQIDTPTSPKKGRGMARLVINRANEKKIVVQFDESGVPAGDEGQKLSTAIGILARTMIPLTCTDWRKVPDHVKEMIWECIIANFEFDLRAKKKIISSIGEKFRTFRNTLTTKYIIPFINRPEALEYPPLVYNFIQKSDWDSFVAIRLSEQFRVLRKKQQLRQEKHKYHHRLSRGGYVALREKLKKERGENAVIDRSELWMKACEKENKEYDPEVLPVVKKIDELKIQVEMGNVSFSGDEDILTQALGSKEHNGRVRGVGKFVTPTSYFHTPNLRADWERDRKEWEKEKKEREKQKMDYDRCLADLEAKLLGCANDQQSPAARFESHSSNFSPTIFSEGQMKGSHSITTKNKVEHTLCKLAVDSVDNIVASGTILEHNIAEVLVSIDVVLNEDALLPIPSEDYELFYVKDALGHHINWPKNLLSRIMLLRSEKRLRKLKKLRGLLNFHWVLKALQKKHGRLLCPEMLLVSILMREYFP